MKHQSLSAAGKNSFKKKIIIESVNDELKKLQHNRHRSNNASCSML
jgi:hypothetical protein